MPTNNLSARLEALGLTMPERPVIHGSGSSGYMYAQHACIDALESLVAALAERVEKADARGAGACYAVRQRIGEDYADACMLTHGHGGTHFYLGDEPPASAQAKCAEPVGAAEQDCQVTFAFSDWTRNGESIYGTEEGLELSMGDFHSGTVFHGSIRLDEEALGELRNALAAKAMPTFLLFKIGSGSGRVGASGGMA